MRNLLQSIEMPLPTVNSQAVGSCFHITDASWVNNPTSPKRFALFSMQINGESNRLNSLLSRVTDFSINSALALDNYTPITEPRHIEGKQSIQIC